MNSFLSTYFISFKNIKYIIILLYTLISFPNEYIIQQIDNKYPKIKELPSGEFFIIMSQGIYISNNDFSNITQIYAFNSIEQSINSNEDNNKTVLSEFKFDADFYILSLVKDYLYLYDFNKRKVTQYNLRADLKGNFYDLIPYQIVNNSLYYVIIFSEKFIENCYRTDVNKYVFNFINYKINFSLEENNNIIINKFLNEYYDSNTCNSYISSTLFSCQIISKKYLICFYLTYYSKKLSISKFEIDDNGFKKDNTFDNSYSNSLEIKDIRSSSSSETNNIFVCFDYDYKYCTRGWNFKCYEYTNYITSKCLIYEINNMRFKEIIYNYDMNNIGIYYFTETKNFILVSNDYINYFRIYNINETSYSINYDYEYYWECKITNSFTLVYNQSINGYNLISDCVNGNNNKQWNIVYNISMFTEFSPVIQPPTELLLENNYFEEEFDIYEEEEEKEYIGEESNEIEENEEKKYIIEENEEEIINVLENEEEFYIYEKEIEEEKIIEGEKTEIVEETEKKEEIKKTEINITKDELINNLENLVNEIEIGQYYEFSGDDFDLIIKPTK